MCLSRCALTERNIDLFRVKSQLVKSLNTRREKKNTSTKHQALKPTDGQTVGRVGEEGGNKVVPSHSYCVWWRQLGGGGSSGGGVFLFWKIKRKGGNFLYFIIIEEGGPQCTLQHRLMTRPSAAIGSLLFWRPWRPPGHLPCPCQLLITEMDELMAQDGLLPWKLCGFSPIFWFLTIPDFSRTTFWFCDILTVI